MVDEEKNTKNEMTGEMTPEAPVKGGEVNETKGKEPVKQETKAINSDDMFIEENE